MRTLTIALARFAQVTPTLANMPHRQRTTKSYLNMASALFTVYIHIHRHSAAQAFERTISVHWQARGSQRAMHGARTQGPRGKPKHGVKDYHFLKSGTA